MAMSVAAKRNVSQRLRNGTHRAFRDKVRGDFRCARPPFLRGIRLLKIRSRAIQKRQRDVSCGENWLPTESRCDVLASLVVALFLLSPYEESI
jgi:hypothetical protein